MAEENQIETPPPAPPEPKIKKKTGTSADEVTIEAETVKQIKRLMEQQEFIQTRIEELSKTRAPITNEIKNPVVEFLRKIDILS